jgi:hypothetical protein
VFADSAYKSEKTEERLAQTGGTLKNQPIDNQFKTQ